jgi:hypothetical protein
MAKVLQQFYGFYDSMQKTGPKGISSYGPSMYYWIFYHGFCWMLHEIIGNVYKQHFTSLVKNRFPQKGTSL